MKHLLVLFAVFSFFVHPVEKQVSPHGFPEYRQKKIQKQMEIETPLVERIRKFLQSIF